MANVGVQPSSQGLFPPGQYPTPTMTVWHQKALCIQIWSTMVDCQRKGPFSASKCSRMFGSKKKKFMLFTGRNKQGPRFPNRYFPSPAHPTTIPHHQPPSLHKCIHAWMSHAPKQTLTTLWSTTELRVRQIILFE